MRSWPRLNIHQQRRVTRLRRTGDCVLALSVGVAMVVYRIGVANHTPSVEELLPGMAAVLERQRGILFGSAGVHMFRWFEVFKEPVGQAGLLVVLGVIGSLTCYQIAHAIEIEG